MLLDALLAFACIRLARTVSAGFGTIRPISHFVPAASKVAAEETNINQIAEEALVSEQQLHDLTGAALVPDADD